MAQETLYLKLERNVELMQDEVRLKDLGKLVCRDKTMLARMKVMKIFQFREDGAKRQVISVMKLIELLQEKYPNLDIQNLGEAEVVVERIKADKYKGFWQYVQIAFVSLICFFGASFTIMAFHNDVGITKVFMEIYEMLSGEPSDGYTILEVSYSAGLAVGIIVFFNHIGGRRITKDPTPIEVEMRIYETDVNNALVETADREGTMIDVD